MVGSQKSLTVSYGTFSCTLEGFEDSFDAMKAVAEFFRDLAAADRCFGAGPPAPDAEALARLVEREVARHVGARTGRAGSVPRGEDAVAGVPGRDAAPGSAAAAVASAMAPAASAMPPPMAVRAAQDEGMAAKLAGLRAVVGRSASLEEPAQASEDPGDAPEGGMGAARPGTGPGPGSASHHEAVEPSPEPAAHLRLGVPRLHRAVPGTEAGHAPQADVAIDAGAIVLPEGEPVPEAAAPGAASLLSPEAEAELMAELAALEAALGTAAPVVTDVEGSEDAAEAAVAGLMAALDGIGGPVAAIDAAPTGQAEPAPPPGATASPASDARDAGVGAILAAIGVPVAVPNAVAAATAPGGSEGVAAAPGDEASSPERDASAPAARQADDAKAPVEPPSGASLPNGAVEPAGPEEPARRLPAAPPVGDEAAVSRLLSRADAQLAEPEASRRREAIAQLRAAVAATEAERRLGEASPEPRRPEDPFRDDLRQAVRPRRPVLPAGAPAGTRAERPRPGPLKLVTSQRVDLPAPEAAFAEPVRPRRVAVEDATGPSGEAPPAGSGGSSGAAFAAFAAEMGAVSLIDVVEAAAAFTSFVEGAEDFSRPQIMDRVRQASPAGVSREDGLRSFETLLRQGTIVRVPGGRFQVTGESRFNPARRAG